MGWLRMQIAYVQLEVEEMEERKMGYCACLDANEYECWALRYSLDMSDPSMLRSHVTDDGGPCQCHCHFSADEYQEKYAGLMEEEDD